MNFNFLKLQLYADLNCTNRDSSTHELYEMTLSNTYLLQYHYIVNASYGGQISICKKYVRRHEVHEVVEFSNKC